MTPLAWAIVAYFAIVYVTTCFAYVDFCRKVSKPVKFSVYFKLLFLIPLIPIAGGMTTYESELKLHRERQINETLRKKMKIYDDIIKEEVARRGMKVE